MSRISRGLTATAAGALVALGVAVVPATAAPGGCGSGDGRLARPQDHRYYVQCAGGVATVLPCPAGQVFAAALQACDLPGRVRPAAATEAVASTAGPARLNGLLFGVKNLSATVRIADAPAGLNGIPVTFSTLGGKPLCTAVTDQFGAARCDGPERLTVPLDEILRGYRASWAGIDGIYLASSATGPVALL
ncbi:chitin binding peritrophin-A domain-containing protein [Streptomyces sp. NPDC051567]|uniref:chitin binding peritrophin-A domain-containing protein n=1 Tax=Streptomyces sp. NPDC051567 TaxID=3365660 RepID=UPI0037897BCD